MFEKLKYRKIRKERWEWSWNGGIPYYLMEILFVNPIKEHIKDLKHINEYSLICSDYGKRTSAYLRICKDYETKCDDYFKKNIEEYIKKYRQTIEKTQNILLHYKETIRDNEKININSNKLKFLAQLLIENNKLYLITQPEITSSLGKALLEEIKKKENSEELGDKIQEIIQPETTILNIKEWDFKKLIKKIKRKGNLKREEIRNKIFDFYWRYRSFYMVDLNGKIEEELQILSDSIKTELDVKRKLEKIKKPKRDYRLSKRGKKITNYTRKIGALRLEGKNAWINLTLLIINIVQNISKKTKIPIELLEKYSFKEIIKLLDSGRKNESWKRREHTVLIISHKKLKKYYGGKALKIKEIITNGKVKNLNSVRGNVAYHGNVKGTAFVITAQDKLSDKINEISKIKNPILIAEQTVPSYLPLIKMSKGIITNEGGILSHAAIVSREYKIPAIIGTKIATQIFNQGDKVVLDTEKGIVYKEDNYSLKDEQNYYIVPLIIGKVNTVGGKARNTAILREIPSIDTSKGLILTTRLFSEMKENKKISKLLKNLKKDNSKIPDIHKEIENFPIPETLIKQLKNLLQNTNKIIVRSSATIEDSGSKSFAGQFVSEVSSVGNIEKAIKLCFKGAFSLNLLSYIENVNQLNLALLIQEYKEVDKSGVAFSINPTNNYFNEIVIESVKGGCEKLVSGKVTPETLILERDNKKLPKSNILSKKELKLLKEKIKTIEKRFKIPMDIEWGIKGKVIWIFQARPITTESFDKYAWKDNYNRKHDK